MKPLKVAVVNTSRCVACGACENACPRGAITVHRGCYSVVKPDLCVGCGLCALQCPTGCIHTKIREGRNA